MFASENPKQYDAVISSGQACPTAAMLVLKLRKKAGPFDWLWGDGGIQKRINFIPANFRFFNPRYRLNHKLTG